MRDDEDDVRLTLPWPPTVNTYWRHVGHKTLLSKAARVYRDAVIAIVTMARIPHTFCSRTAVSIDAYPPDLRARDLDNLPKGVLDSLKHAGLILDDRVIDELTIRRCAVVKGGELRVWLRKMS